MTYSEFLARDATVFIAEWPVLDPDLPMINLKAKARTELRHLRDADSLKPIREPRMTVVHGETPTLRAVVPVREFGLVSTWATRQAEATIMRCPNCDRWTCAEKWQRQPHQCAGVTA